MDRNAQTETHGRAAAITGMGIISCLGNTLDEVTESLRAGRSGIVLDEERLELGFRGALTGKISGFNFKERGVSRKLRRTMDEPAQYAYAAALDAMKDASLEPADVQNDRCGVIFGNDSCVKPAVESVDLLREHGETHFIGSGHIFRAISSTVTMNLAAHIGVLGANWTIAAACASGSHVLGQALMLIRSNLQDIVISGGAQEINWQSMASFDALNAFSTRHDEPEKASRPFDADRDGLVPSGGAACLIVEELEHALGRGAEIYAIIGGYGFSSAIGTHLSEPEPSGAIRSMVAALNDARVEPGRINYINAHATATPLGDLAEAQAISEVFGNDVPVTSTKSMTGHECWMAGASEALYTILMSKNGFIAPSINFEKHDEDAPEINVVNRYTPAEIRLAVSNSFGFGGTNATIVLDFFTDTDQP